MIYIQGVFFLSPYTSRVNFFMENWQISQKYSHKFVENISLLVNQYLKLLLDFVLKNSSNKNIISLEQICNDYFFKRSLKIHV